MWRYAVGLLVVGSGLLGTARESEAQYWSGYPYAGFLSRPVYSIYDQDRIPYFALHPPVYYSYPVARPYGFSPFAYPGIVPTPQFKIRQESLAHVVKNPHVEQPAEGPTLPAPDKQGAHRPQRIRNPYYSPEAIVVLPRQTPAIPVRTAAR